MPIKKNKPRQQRSRLLQLLKHNRSSQQSSQMSEHQFCLNETEKTQIAKQELQKMGDDSGLQLELNHSISLKNNKRYSQKQFQSSGSIHNYQYKKEKPQHNSDQQFFNGWESNNQKWLGTYTNWKTVQLHSQVQQPKQSQKVKPFLKISKNNDAIKCNRNSEKILNFDEIDENPELITVNSGKTNKSKRQEPKDADKQISAPYNISKYPLQHKMVKLSSQNKKQVQRNYQRKCRETIKNNFRLKQTFLKNRSEDDGHNIISSSFTGQKKYKFLKNAVIAVMKQPVTKELEAQKLIQDKKIVKTQEDTSNYKSLMSTSSIQISKPQHKSKKGRTITDLGVIHRNATYIDFSSPNKPMKTLHSFQNYNYYRENSKTLQIVENKGCKEFNPRSYTMKILKESQNKSIRISEMTAKILMKKKMNALQRKRLQQQGQQSSITESINQTIFHIKKPNDLKSEFEKLKKLLVHEKKQFRSHANRSPLQISNIGKQKQHYQIEL